MKRTLRQLLTALLLVTAAPATVPAATVDVLVVYTNAALYWVDWFGQESVMNSTIDFMISDANIVLDNSRIYDHDYRLVGTRRVNYVEVCDQETNLRKLFEVDGAMDEVLQWRDEVGADVVSLIVSTDSLSCSMGMGKWASERTPLNPDVAFSVVTIQINLLGYHGLVFAHELGHNFGLSHTIEDMGNDAALALENYAFAWKYWVPGELTRRSTTMAYPTPGTDLPVWHFSNPDIVVGGVAAGDSSKAFNAKVFNDNAGQVAAFRSTTVLPNTVWVSTSYGGWEGGSWSYPYNTVQEGITYVPAGGNLMFTGGSEPWSGTINKSMTLSAHGGDMVIGQ